MLRPIPNIVIHVILPLPFAQNSKRIRKLRKILESIEVAGPGFINLSLHNAVLGEYIIQMRAEREKLLLLAQEKRQRIIFEYVSANPTGPLNVVSARAASLGDACAQLCKAVGHEVTREYYVNDHGNQIVLLGQSVLLRYLESCGRPSEIRRTE